jgi:hypothetical protein
MVISYITAPPVNVFEAFGRFLGSVISAGIQAFALVTFIFAVIERFVKRDEKLNDWKPSDLPPVPAAKAMIHRADPIVGMVFAVFGIIIFNVAPWLFGAGDVTNKTFIPVFDLNVLKSMLPIINTMFCVGILKEVARLVIGKYDFRLAIAVTVFNIISLILFLYIFAPPAIWNANFMMSVHDAYGWQWTATSEAAYVWAIIPKVLTGLTIFGMVVDTISVAVRAFRHSEIRQTI